MNAPVVGIAPVLATGGYWLVASDGRVFSFTVPFYGSEGADPPGAPVGGIAVASNGGGYSIVDSAGTSTHFGA